MSMCEILGIGKYAALRKASFQAAVYKNGELHISLSNKNMKIKCSKEDAEKFFQQLASKNIN
ncbi:hypothetical protein AAEX28_07325 [Lentisphaerota bacterium WC36G]|nr:hypothetical protein LJT99_10185 [Lentisphaerae bacterium WC36]UDQ97785.1 hypothetical protein LJT99_15220 [Lentisphaerae bacterium WC36]